VLNANARSADSEMERAVDPGGVRPSLLVKSPLTCAAEATRSRMRDSPPSPVGRARWLAQPKLTDQRQSAFAATPLRRDSLRLHP